MAEHFGVSDVAVAKWCKRMGVPRPGRGYWARKEAGQDVKRTPLPKPKKDQKRFVRPILPAGERPKQIEDPPGLEHFECPIPVPDTLENEHQLITKTRGAIDGARTDEDGLIRPRSRTRLDVRVSQGCVERALRIMNALVVSIENAGYQVGVKTDCDSDGKRTGYRAFVEIEGEKIFFSMSEKTIRTEREPTAEEQRRMKREYWFRGPFYDYQPTGLLTLRSEGTWHGKRHRMTWSDGKRQKLEDCLFKFVRSLLLSAEACKYLRKEAEEQRVREAYEQELREERERRRLEEAQRRLALENSALDWAHAMRIRRFVDAVASTASEETDMTPERRVDIEAWLSWAHWYADAFDPLCPRADFVERLTQISEDDPPQDGFKDAIRKVSHDLGNLSDHLSACGYDSHWSRKSWWR